MFINYQCRKFLLYWAQVVSEEDLAEAVSEMKDLKAAREVKEGQVEVILETKDLEDDLVDLEEGPADLEDGPVDLAAETADSEEAAAADLADLEAKVADSAADSAAVLAAGLIITTNVLTEVSEEAGSKAGLEEFGLEQNLKLLSIVLSLTVGQNKLECLSLTGFSA
jgi:hypothetical protein